MSYTATSNVEWMVTEQDIKERQRNHKTCFMHFAFSSEGSRKDDNTFLTYLAVAVSVSVSAV